MRPRPPSSADSSSGVGYIGSDAAQQQLLLLRRRLRLLRLLLRPRLRRRRRRRPPAVASTRAACVHAVWSSTISARLRGATSWMCSPVASRDTTVSSSQPGGSCGPVSYILWPENGEPAAILCCALVTVPRHFIRRSGKVSVQKRSKGGGRRKYGQGRMSFSSCLGPLTRSVGLFA